MSKIQEAIEKIVFVRGNLNPCLFSAGVENLNEALTLLAEAEREQADCVKIIDGQEKEIAADAELIENLAKELASVCNGCNLAQMSDLQTRIKYAIEVLASVEAWRKKK